MSYLSHAKTFLIEDETSAATSEWAFVGDTYPFTIWTLFSIGTASVTVEGSLDKVEANVVALGSAITVRGITTFTDCIPWVRVKGTPAGGAVLSVGLSAQNTT